MSSVSTDYYGMQNRGLWKFIHLMAALFVPLDTPEDIMFIICLTAPADR